VTTDWSDIELPGPWAHRYLSANGARFHIAESRPAGGAPSPLVVLLHGFPEFWWAWRHHLPRLAEAGFHAVAMDLRGYGASDKTPRGYDAMTLADDVAGVVRALGTRTAVLVGHGWGGYVAWTTAARHPDAVSALCVVAAPHPTPLTRAPRNWFTRAAILHLLAMQTPWLPERRIAKGRYVEQHLQGWSAAASTFPSTEEVARYRAALSLWPSPHCALEYHRWLVRSRLRADGRAFNHIMRGPVQVPVLHIGGAGDPAEPARAVAASARRVEAPFEHRVLADAGHYPHEEQPEQFARVLLDWLSVRAAAGGHGAG
jgi:pimeloyl-ACP methyl ester carboxylesterase